MAIPRIIHYCWMSSDPFPSEILQILSYVSETERVTTKQRQREGIDVAKLNGVSS